MSKLNNVAMVISKIFSILMWVAVGGLVTALVAACIGVGVLNSAIREGVINSEDLITEAREDLEEKNNEYADLITKENFDRLVKLMKTEDVLNEDGTVRIVYVILVLVDSIATCVTFALVFRNVHLILKTAQNSSPFQADITRRIRNIGFFLLGLAAFELTLSGFSGVSFNSIYAIIGILMLCLSSFFRYGESLQAQSDGLI